MVTSFREGNRAKLRAPRDEISSPWIIDRAFPFSKRSKDSSGNMDEIDNFQPARDFIKSSPEKID